MSVGLQAQPHPRITKAIDDSRFIRIEHTKRAELEGAVDLGRVAADLPIERILLQLNSSRDQEVALEELLVQQQDRSSPNFHRWLTPTQFGERFGASREDLEEINQWLEDHGFRIDGIANGRRIIEFSGVAKQVEETFHTEIHYYAVDNERHVANARDIALPDALAPVVHGVVSLHDFRLRSFHRVIQQLDSSASGSSGRYRPLYNSSNNMHVLGPYDFAAIYNVVPLWNAGFDGTGQTIAIPASTKIDVTDVRTFRSMFGLPANDPQIVVNGADPGTDPIGGGEAASDLEWSGAVAKGATIKLVATRGTAATDGVALSSKYIVDNNVASVLSLSVGGCEARIPDLSAFYGQLWQQAAAQGISVFVGSGDSGSALCDPPQSVSGNQNTTQPASRGLAVNGTGSSPYNVAVGGTQFADTDDPSKYWNDTNDSNQASAKGYIPEVIWNQSKFTTSGAMGNNLYAGGGGVSTLWPTPSWQTGNGVPTGDPADSSQHHRYMPDISLNAAGHDGYFVQFGGQQYLLGGTSISGPSFAGIMAIVNQYSGSGNGNPNPRLYQLAAQAPSVYHDVTGGSNAVPCTVGSPDCAPSPIGGSVGQMKGYNAGPGYDLASGWGSVDVQALATNWSANAGGTPSINAITNGASFQTGVIAPGAIVAIFGVSLATSSAAAPSLPLPTTLGGTQVLINGQPVPLFYAAPNQVNAQVPFELVPGKDARVIIQVSGTSSAARTVSVTAYQPGIFVLGGTHGNQGAILLAGSSTIAMPATQGISSAPAHVGDYVSIYCTGLGSTSPSVATNTPAPNNPPATITNTVSVTIGGQAANVTFAGLAPGFVGLYQVNAQVPQGIAVGAAIPVVLTQGSTQSNTATIAVQ